MNEFESALWMYNYSKEYRKELDERIKTLNQTAKEQDILDGGTGEEIYRFHLREAINPGWGEDGAGSDNSVYKLFKT